ncbi:MAG: hypothetical protein WC438_02795 [Candidatus Pacearchaeota archaeon]
MLKWKLKTHERMLYEQENNDNARADTKRGNGKSRKGCWGNGYGKTTETF